MRNYLTIFLLLCGLLLGGCKKENKTTKIKSASPTPASKVATAAAPTPAPTPSKPAIDQTSEVVVFGYHRFEKKVRRPDTEITPEAFEAQLKELQEKKIPVIPMQDFLAWKRGEKAIPSKAAIITIDDGWKTTYEVAWPILKKYNYPFTLFIYTEGIKGGKYGGGAAMSWEQLAEMRDAGVDIQAHSATHQDLRKAADKATGRKNLSPQEYTEWLDSEVAGSKATLEQKLGIRVNCFAYPFGYYNDVVRDATKKARFEAVFTVYGQTLTYNSPNEALGRYLMEANKPKVFENAIKFGGSSAGGSGTATGAEEIPLGSINPQPADGATASNKPLIKANLGAIGGIDPASVKMRVSGLGVVPAKYDPATKIISYQVTQSLHGDTCAVIVEAMIGERKAEAHWTFTLKEEAAKTKAAPAPAASPKK
ncbi:MAG: polysaccharide deacetylase family protein [Chthoniobacterales bacterium]